jgi:hypothetical protein
VRLLKYLLPAVLLTGAAFGQVTINGIANQSVTGVVGTTYYVDASEGLDANDGKDPGRAWKTVSKVNGSTFSARDRILFKRGEVWRETLTIPSSGTVGNPITFGAYGTSATLPTFYGADTVTGSWTNSSGSIYWATWTFASNNVFQNETPLLKKTALASVTAAGQFFYDSGASRLYVWTTDSTSPSTKTIEASTNGPNFYGIIRGLNKDNLIIENLRAVKTNYTGIYCEECDNVVVRGNTLEQTFQNSITVVGNLGQANPTNISVESNTILNSGTGRGITAGTESECVGINMQGVQNGWVTNNYITGQGGEGIQTNGGSTNVIITGNTVINTYSTGIYLGGGWGNGGNVTGAVASWNYIELGAISISPALTIATESATDAVNGFYVHHNILKGKNTAIGCLLYGQGAFAGGINNGHVHHNVCTNDQYGFKLLGPTTSTNNTFSNNIISVTNNGRAYWINTAPSVGSNPITNYAIDYDDVFSPSVATFIVEMPTSTFYTLAQWIANTAHADHAVATDPLFVNSASDWHVSTGSPAINAGVTVASVDQYVVGTAPDIGVYEFGAPTSAQRIAGYIAPATISTTSDFSTTGYVAGGIGSSVAGFLEMKQGSAPTSQPANSFWFSAPTSIPTAYGWKVPTADGAGPVTSDGAGQLSVGGTTGTGTTYVRSTSPTIVTPVIADLTSMNHNHSNTAGGGPLTVGALSGLPMMSWSANLSGTGITASTTVFLKAYSGGTTTTTENTQYWSTTHAGTLKGLFIRTTGTQPNSTCVCTVRVNSVDTGITTTVTANAVAGTFSDLTHTATVAANDKISLKCVQGTSLSATMGDFNLGMIY